MTVSVASSAPSSVAVLPPPRSRPRTAILRTLLPSFLALSSHRSLPPTTTPALPPGRHRRTTTVATVTTTPSAYDQHTSIIAVDLTEPSVGERDGERANERDREERRRERRGQSGEREGGITWEGEKEGTKKPRVT